MKSIKLQTSLRLIFIVVIVVFGVISIIGSGGQKLFIKASDNLFSENNTQKVAIFGSSVVIWSKIGNFKGIIGVNDSKKSLEWTLRDIDAALKDKGYDVVACQPVGIAYHNPFWKFNKEVFICYSESLNDDELEIKKQYNRYQPPIYQYNIEGANSDVHNALKNVFESMELAVFDQSMDTFSVDDDDLRIIKDFSKADVLFFTKISGEKYTKKRKAGLIALEIGMNIMAVLAGVSPGSFQQHDCLNSCIVAIDTNTGELIWQDSRDVTAINPVKQKEGFAAKLLSSFPEKNKLIDSNQYCN